MDRSQACSTWRLSARTGLLGLLALTLWSGCPGDPINREALEAALEKARPDDAGEESLGGRVLAFDGAQPHRMTLRLELAITPDGKATRRIVLDRTVDRGDSGAFAVVDRRHWTDPVAAPEGRDDGREAVFDGSRFATRRAWGPWQSRETWRNEHVEYLARMYETAPEVLEAFEPYLERRPEGKTTIAGLPGTWERVSLKPGVRPKALPAETLEALRNHDDHWTRWIAATHRPSEVKGRIAVRRGGLGEILAADLTVTGAARVDGVDARFSVRLKMSIGELPKGAIAWPKGEVLASRRDRTWLMVKSVLRKQLGDIYRR